MDLTAYLDEYLDVSGVPDYPGALNGLQVESGRGVSRIAAAVDATEAAARGARDAGCDLLLVHHGLFWDGRRPVTGRRYRRLRLLLTSDIAVYASHLPLDVHPEVGNNAVLARELELEVEGSFGAFEGRLVGLRTRADLAREELTRKLARALGSEPRLLPGGPERIRRAGVLTGGGGSMIEQAVDAGLDTLITGEGPHHTYFDAMEWGINVYYGGHYATETWGVRALAAHLEARFGLPWTFLDLPTGL